MSYRIWRGQPRQRLPRPRPDSPSLAPGRCRSCSATSAPRDPTVVPSTSSTRTANAPTAVDVLRTAPRRTRRSAACRAELVRFIHEADSDQAKGELFAACNNGQVAVLVGSTGKHGRRHQRPTPRGRPAPRRPRLATGRHRTTRRPHHAPGQPDTPKWIYPRMSLASSVDAYMWQKVQSKAHTLEQALRGRSGVRIIESPDDMVITAGMIKAAAVDNPMLVEQEELKARLAQLERRHKTHQAAQRAYAHTARSRAQDAQIYLAAAAEAQAALGGGSTPAATRSRSPWPATPTPPAPTPSRAAPAAAPRSNAASRTAPIGEFGGFAIVVSTTHPHRPAAAGGHVPPRRRPPQPSSSSPPPGSSTATRSTWSPGWRTGSTTSNAPSPACARPPPTRSRKPAGPTPASGHPSPTRPTSTASGPAWPTSTRNSSASARSGRPAPASPRRPRTSHQVRTAGAACPASRRCRPHRPGSPPPGRPPPSRCRSARPHRRRARRRGRRDRPARVRLPPRRPRRQAGSPPPTWCGSR